jgi:hypothetical protein
MKRTCQIITQYYCTDVPKGNMSCGVFVLYSYSYWKVIKSPVPPPPQSYVLFDTATYAGFA